ncbi:MAG TPA: polysaccharide pyruvyl transferase family protein [Pseudonocardiaceae bacterium]
MTLFARQSTTLLYVGWTGQRNLGDDAIADALIPRLGVVEQAHAPYQLVDLAKRTLGGGLAGGGQRALLLGGGTAIGRRNWRLVLSANGAVLARAKPWFMIGAGVEDPAFQGRNSFSGNGELSRWRGICRNFAQVTVRGPRSVELLETAGIPTRMVGDPALLHEPASIVEPEDKVLGINLGYGDDLWGHDHGRVVDALAGLVKSLAGEGWRVRAIVVNPNDEPALRACLSGSGIGEDRAEVVMANTVERFFAAVAPCTLLIAERLHALVLAAAAGVPVVGLEYQPKCADFLASVGAEDRAVRTDRVTSDGLHEHVVDLVENRHRESARLLGEVAGLRALLTAELDGIRRRVPDGQALRS